MWAALRMYKEQGAGMALLSQDHIIADSHFVPRTSPSKKANCFWGAWKLHSVQVRVRDKQDLVGVQGGADLDGAGGSDAYIAAGF